MNEELEQGATLARGLQLLQCFGPGERPLGNGELAIRTGLDKATVARLTYTLVALGYLRRDAGLRKYRPGPGILRLAYPLLASMAIRQIARPLMKELATRVHGIVGLGIRDRANMVYVDAAYGPDVPPPYIDRGMTVPVLASAIGAAWLARAQASEREQAINQARVSEPGRYAASAMRIQQAFRDLDARGYCVSRGYLSPSREAVAVPLGTALRSELYVFNCAAATDGATAEEVRAVLGPLLVEMVARVEMGVGLRPL